MVETQVVVVVVVSVVVAVDSPAFEEALLG
jgi:hypothetical protein